jgi:hypothetical protein
MKDFIALSLTLSAAAAAVSRSDVLSAVKASNNNPEARRCRPRSATRLLP